MSLATAFPLPPVVINGYLWDSLQKVDPTLTTLYDGVQPFFPISDSRAGDWPWETKPYVVYDQLLKFRSSPFYRIHKAQELYVIKGSPTEVLSWANAIAMILDRQDAAAQEVNEWSATNMPNAGIFFHWFKVLQIDQTAENRMDVSINQKYLSSMVVEFEYHTTYSTVFD